MGALIDSATWGDVPYFEANAVLTGGPDCPDNIPIQALANRTSFLKKQIDDAVSGALTIEYANRLKTTRSIAMTGDGSWVVTFDGSGNVTAAMTLANTGVVAGTYPVVTIDSKGRVTGARALQSADLPANATLSGAPTAPTAAPGSNNQQLANTAFVQAALAALVGSSPAALDTLNELAAALGNDPNFATTITNSLALKAPLASPPLTGNPTAPTQPQGDSSTKLATTEFVQLAKQSVPVRQTVLGGVTDNNGRANFISAGAGLSCNLSATAAALSLAFAGGFGAGGAIDYIERITADAAGYWPNLPANCLNYLTITRTGAGQLTAGSTLAPVQYGYAYNPAAQALLHFDGAAGSTAMLDDFGNTWTAQGGAKLQSNWSKFGGTALGGGGANNALNGAGDYIRTTGITTLGSGGWAIRCWVNPSALPGANSGEIIAAFSNAAGSVVVLHIYNNAGSTKFAYNLSSSGASFDIANIVMGTTTPVVGTGYFVELTYDAAAGVYRLYVNGVQEASTVSASRVGGLTMGTIGAATNATQFFVGYIDEFEFLPYCDHPNGTAYAMPGAAKSISTPGYASDWFDLSSFTMKSPSAASAAPGSNPTFAASNKLYVGEAITGIAGVSSVVSYAFQGKAVVDSAALATSQLQILNHNIGAAALINTSLVNITQELGYSQGDEVMNIPNYGDGTNGRYWGTAVDQKVIRQNLFAAIAVPHKSTAGTVAAITPASWKLRHRIGRAF